MEHKCNEWGWSGEREREGEETTNLRRRGPGEEKKRDEERHIMLISAASLPFQNSGKEITKKSGRETFFSFFLTAPNFFSLCISVSPHTTCFPSL